MATDSAATSSQELRILGFHWHKLTKKREDHSYGSFVVGRVMPLIHIIFQDYVSAWAQESEVFLKKYTALQKCITHEVKTLFISISHLLEKQSLNKAISEPMQLAMMSVENLINDAFSEDERLLFPAYEERLIQDMKKLMHHLLKEGFVDFVRPFVTELSRTTHYVDDTENGIQYQCFECFKKIKRIHYQALNNEGDLRCPICNSNLQTYYEQKLETAPSIITFNESTFIPSYFQWQNEQELFWQGVAGKWQMLLRFCWLWSGQYDFFRKKSLNYRDQSDAERAMRLLYLNSCRGEIKKIKEKKQGQMVSFQKRRDLEAALFSLLSNADVAVNTDSIAPLTISLHLNDNCLELIVGWTLEIKQVITLCTFENSEGERCTGIRSALENNNTRVSVKNDYSGENAEKYLSNIGLMGVVRTIFITCIDSYCFSVKQSKVAIDSISEANKKALVSQIFKFNDIKCRWFRKNVRYDSLGRLKFKDQTNVSFDLPLKMDTW